MNHKFMKLAGIKDIDSFYKAFPTEEAFFKAFPKTSKKAAWGAALGTDQFISGPGPINPYPQGFKIPMEIDSSGATGYHPSPITNMPYKGTIPGEGLSTNPAWENYPGLGARPATPTLPNAPQMMPNPDYIPNKGEGNLNRGQVPNKTEGQKEQDKQAINPKNKPGSGGLQMPDGASSGGFTGQGILAGLEIASALMPPDKIRRRYVRPEDMQSYNPNQYGTGSQAISEYGNTLKGKKKKAFWGALIGVAVDKAKEVKKGIHQNIENAVAPILNIANNNAAEAARLDNLYLSGGVQDMSKLQPVQPLIPQQPQYPQYMAHGGEMKYKNGGDLKTYDGGNTSLSSYNPFDGGTFKFSGNSHEQGGVDISYKGQEAEVEGGETAFKDKQGDLKIMGNLIVPGTNMKYKTMSKLLSKKEEKAQKYIDRGSLLLNTASPTDPYESLSFNSGKAMAIGGLHKQKQIAELKEHLGNMQEAHLEEIKEKKMNPKIPFKNGGAIYAEDGAKVPGDPIYEAMLLAAAKRYGVNPDHLQRLVTQESNFSAKAKSAKGALGVMQFTPETAKKYGVQDILSSEKTEDVYKVVDAGVKHFKELLDQNKGDYYLATAAYNGGQGAVNFVKKKLKKDDLTGVEWVEFMQNRNKTAPTKNKHAWQNETLKYVQNITGVEDIENIGQNFRQEYYGYKTPKPTDGMFNGTYKIPDFDYTPSPNQIQTVDPNYTPLDLKQPPPYNKPSNARGINPLQFLGEGYAMATNQEEPVKAQLYTPELYSPYQVSFQDRLNENQSTFNSVEKQLAYDPTSLATLAGQKYSADSSVLADEFRTNQTIANDIINKNVSLLNEAEKTNLGILDQQYVRQSTAKSNTKKINQDALSSISSKLLQKEASNNQLRVYENLYQNYSFDPHTGKALFQGPKQGEEKPIDYGIPQPLTAGQPAKTVVKTSPTGQKTTTDTYEQFDSLMEPWKIKPKKSTSKPINIYKMFRG